MARRRRPLAPRRPRLRLRGLVCVVLAAGLAVVAVKYSRGDALFGAVAAGVLAVVVVVGLAMTPRQVRYQRVLVSGIARAGETVPVEFAPASPPRRLAREILDLTLAGPRYAVPCGGDRLAYALALPRRGLWRLGPAIIRHSDPFGLAYVDDVVAPVSEIAVAPRAADVVLPRLASEDREVAGRVLTADRVVDPATVREYRHGDPRRLVHWRASLRRDRLMVRGDRPRGHADVWVVVDTVAGRRGRHPGPEVDDAEDALAVAAAVAEAAMRQGHRLHLVETGGGALRRAFEEQFGREGGSDPRADMVLEPEETTANMLRMMARLEFDSVEQSGWQARVVAAAQAAGGAVAVVAAIGYLDPAREGALAEIAQVCDPCLAWTADPEDSPALARAGFASLGATL